MCRFLCRHLFSSFFCTCQGAQLLGHMVRVCLQKPSICLPKCLYYFASPAAMCESSCCPIPSSAFGVVSVPDIDHFNRCVVVLFFFYCNVVALFFFFLILFIYLFLAVLGVRCCMDFSLAVVCGLLIGVTSLVGEHRLLGLQSL